MIESKFTKSAFEYYNTIRKIKDNPEFIDLRDKIYAEMDEYKKTHPNLTMIELKSILYERIAESFTPVLIPYCPFYYEMGLRDAKSLGGGPAYSVSMWDVDLSVRNARNLDFIAELGISSPGLGLAVGPVFDEDHHSPGYTKVFEKGLLGIIRDIDQVLDTEPQGTEKYIFNISARRGLCAMLRIAERFKEAAQQKLKNCNNEDEKKSLEMIAKTAGRIPAEPPKTFYEGLAALYFIREVIVTLDGVGISTLGHVDRLLGPLYKSDIENGRLTREEAEKLVEIWLCIPDIRCDAEHDSWACISTCIELGGCDADGNTVYNEVTDIFIENHDRMKLLNPKLNCRISTESPREYLELLGKSLLRGHNVIALHNDNVIIPALMSAGKDIYDARLYVNGGCQETITEGCEHSAGVLFYFNLPKVFDMCMNPIDTAGFTEKTINALPKVIEEAESFEVFYEKYFENMKKMLFHAADVRRPYGEKWRNTHPSPLYSSTLKGCIESGKDYTAGGAKYNPSTLDGFGFATLTDSLYAVKKAVYDDKIISLGELRNALLANWNGYEKLQKKLKSYPKFGHSHKDADEFAGKVFNDINEYVMTLDNERGAKYIFSTFTFSSFEWGSSYVRATADGRNSGDLLSQSIGPSRMQKTDSLTDSIVSLNSIGLDKSAGVSVLDVMIPNSSNLTPEVMASVFSAFASSRGQVLQPNYVTVDQMIAAREDPASYKDLIVRVCGLSVYFVNLNPRFQNEMIERNRYKV